MFVTLPTPAAGVFDGTLATMTTHSEHLRPPLSWWAGVLCFAAAWGWIVLVAGTRQSAAITALAVAGTLGFAVWSYGRLAVVVDDSSLVAGRARLDAPWIGEVEALDSTAYRHVLGPGADARALLVTRPWLDRGVLVRIADPSDPTPYWIVGTRDPHALAAAIDSVRQTGTRTDQSTGGM